MNPDAALSKSSSVVNQRREVCSAQRRTMSSLTIPLNDVNDDDGEFNSFCLCPQNKEILIFVEI